MKKTFYILLLITAMLTSSCSDWLDLLPNNEQVTDKYWKSKEEVEAVVASGYYYMREATPFYIDWGELRGGSVYAYLAKWDQYQLQNFKMVASSKLCKWDVFYEAINMANSVIKYAPKVLERDNTYTDGAMKSHQAEAYFMRALMYFYLVRNFKEVPLITEPYVNDKEPYSKAKSTEEQIIEQIKSDIRTALESQAAKEFYDEGWAGASKGRVTKWALYALMADVCLWSEDYDGCITNADYLIKATAARRPAFMSIPEQWFSIFNPGNSNESIFEINWDGTTFAQTSLSPSSIFKLVVNAEYQYTPLMTERLKSERIEALLNNSDPVRSEFGAYVLLSSGADNGAGCIWKYLGTDLKDITAVRTTNDANFIIYRMADVMLMKAEALIRKGSTSWAEATSIINQIRLRSNLKELDINLGEIEELDLLKIVLNERDIEFAAEGKRWYDLLRFGKSNNFKYKTEFIEMIIENSSSSNSNFLRSALKNEYAWYLPISYTELENNALLTQNPYYGVSKK